MYFNVVDSQGIEPRMPEAPDLQSSVVTNATRYPKNLTKNCRPLCKALTLVFCFSTNILTINNACFNQ